MRRATGAAVGRNPVSILVPCHRVRGVVWGAIFLGEAVTPTILAGCAVVLLGTALVAGVLGAPRRSAA